MTLLASLVTRLSLESSSFSTGMKRARRQAQDDTSAIRKSLDDINGRLKTFGQGLQLAAIGAAAKRALEYASSLAEAAQQLGVTAKELQIYRYAASQVGIEQEAMDKGLQKLTQSMGKAEVGSKPLQQAFQAIGISMADLKGKTAGDIIPKIADALAKIPDPARRAAVEVTLFGKAGQQLDNLLAGGSKGINQLAQEAEKLGIVLSNEQIQNADALADRLSALKQVLESRIAGVVADNAQSILALANSLAALATGLARFWSQNPARALGIIGAIGGGRIGAAFGPVGAAIGATAGYIAGGAVAPNTPQSLRQQAQYFQRNAKQNANAMGYYRPGITAAERQRILSSGGVRSNLDRAKQYYAQADHLANGGAIATVGKPAVGDADVPSFLSGPGKTKHGSDHTEQLAKERLRVQYDLDKEVMDGQHAILDAQSSLTNDYESRADYAKQMVDLELQQKQRQIKFDLDMVLTDKTISADQKEEARLRAARASKLADDLHVIDLQKVTNDRALQEQRDAEALDDARLNAKKDLLQSEEQLATTASERRKIELQILDLTYQQRKQALDHIRNDILPNGDFSHSQAERNQAGLDLQSLQAGYGNARQGVLQSTRGPLESFLSSLPDTAAKANEALESIAANGLQSLSEGLADAIVNAKNLGQVFSNVAKQILADLLKIEIEKGLAKVLGSVLNFSGTIGGNPALSTPALKGAKAAGGPVMGGGAYLVGEKGPEIFIPRLSGSIMPNSAVRTMAAMRPNNDNGGARVTIVPSPYFDAHVDGRAAAIAAPLSQVAAQVGSADAQATLGRRASRQIP